MFSKRILAVAAAGCAALAGFAVTPFAEAATGRAVTALTYDLGDTAFPIPDSDGAAELRGVVRFPSRLPAGKLPLVLLLHGQNRSCALTEGDATWPCPAGVPEFPSYRGYDYLGEALARDGFVVVSIAAGGINHFMGVSPQRAALINKHLALWERFTSTGGGDLAGRFTDLATGRAAKPPLRGHVDLTRVGTLGHSVAGEGVMRHASDKYRGDWPPGVRVRGVVPIASRYFNYDNIDDDGVSPDRDVSGVLVTGMPFAVVSATCWGSGDEAYFRNARGRTQQPAFLVRLVAGNHNHFNTVWSDATDFPNGDDSTCPADPRRPSAQAQRDFAVTYLRAFYRMALKGDHSGEPVLTGARSVPGVNTEHEHLP
ncbi:hypothetical protein Val02_52940 [Virgisporangium aliadipatigenens]|uniref:Alpha/beta hydrolase n=1 Tax=Virgisporangium aliadipatigenens TaxID=741659 RepID=A0A8J3YQD4_9ACTN|nr:hypothetical protein [Virgisporangium aliadipatigenens]GIJ48408.1 hypothetical protein Val02_52940 [Virgisporangium aliadipatigenens]